jgi:tripartite-type tricarboxylate transporter receptor subunit TctC
MTIARRVLTIGTGLLLARPAVAQAWPVRPVRFIVPYGAGNQADQVARVLADGLSARWGQRLVVDNQAGAGGGIGVSMIARAAPDGYTLGFIAIAALAVTPHIQAAPYDPLNDFTGIAAVSISNGALVVPDALPARDVAGLVALARSRAADPLFFYSPGIGTLPHLNAEVFRRALDFPATHVPYRTAASGVADLVAGRVQFGLDGITVTLPQIEAGRVRALVATSQTRLMLLPDVPSLAEAVPGLELFSAWQAVQAPRGFPEEIAQKIAADTAALLADPAFVRRLPQGTDPLPMPREGIAQRVRAEHARFGVLVRELGLGAG